MIQFAMIRIVLGRVDQLRNTVFGHSLRVPIVLSLVTRPNGEALDTLLVVSEMLTEIGTGLLQVGNCALDRLADCLTSLVFQYFPNRLRSEPARKSDLPGTLFFHLLLLRLQFFNLLEVAGFACFGN